MDCDANMDDDGSRRSSSSLSSSDWEEGEGMDEPIIGKYNQIWISGSSLSLPFYHIYQDFSIIKIFLFNKQQITYENSNLSMAI